MGMRDELGVIPLLDQRGQGQRSLRIPADGLKVDGVFLSAGGSHRQLAYF